MLNNLQLRKKKKEFHVICPSDKFGVVYNIIHKFII